MSGIFSAAQRALVVAALIGSLAACATGPRSAADCGQHFTSGSGLLGLMGAMGAFDRPAGPECRRPASARNSAPPVQEQEPPEVGGMTTFRDFGAGQTVYSSGDCIGAVVNGVCHGTIAPGATSLGTCYGEMIGGVCTGPMF